MFGIDTRIAHRFLFRGLTPANCTCILGTYRGDASCSFVTRLNVTAGGDPLVGVHAHFVASKMREFEKRYEILMQRHQKWLQGAGKNAAPEVALVKFVAVLALLLEGFLTVHPFMDGNGHSARLLTFTVMAAGGYPATGWDIDAKQPYGDALAAHRRGDTVALQTFLLDVIRAPAAAIPTAAPAPAATVPIAPVLQPAPSSPTA